MALSKQDLNIKINKLINEQLEAGYQIAVPWLANLLIIQCKVPKSKEWGEEQREETILAMREGYVQFIVEIMKKRSKDEIRKKSDSQGILPGYERLPMAYVIKRSLHPHTKPERMIVRIQDMTYDELIAKIEELKGMRIGLDIHIAELQRYIKLRWPGSLVA